MTRRAFVVVLDACGVGGAVDAAKYGDEGANTLESVARGVGGMELPVMAGLGLGRLAEIDGVPRSPEPAAHGRLHPEGAGKDSATGHWELMGVLSQTALPTYPAGFPSDVLMLLESATGMTFIGNVATDGMAAIERFGRLHVQTGRPILYTSQDSVMQIAAHEDVLSVAELQDLCATVREAMTGPHAVGRIIARPFAGPPEAPHRTAGRRDFALTPPGRSYLQELRDDGIAVHGVGKVNDLFGEDAISDVHAGSTNRAALDATGRLMSELDSGLVFTNLIETDQSFAHRKDLQGFHAALREIDGDVGDWLAMLRADDLLILTADHGCDPTMSHTDHTREQVPLLAVFEGSAGRRHDGPMSDVGASVLRWLSGRDADLPGTSFVD